MEPTDERNINRSTSGPSRLHRTSSPAPSINPEQTDLPPQNSLERAMDNTLADTAELASLLDLVHDLNADTMAALSIQLLNDLNAGTVSPLHIERRTSRARLSIAATDDEPPSASDPPSMETDVSDSEASAPPGPSTPADAGNNDGDINHNNLLELLRNAVIINEEPADAARNWLEEHIEEEIEAVRAEAEWEQTPQAVGLVALADAFRNLSEELRLLRDYSGRIRTRLEDWAEYLRVNRQNNARMAEESRRLIEDDTEPTDG